MEYKCEECGIKGVKLWRLYKSCNPHLKCCDCSSKDQEKDISSMKKDGLYFNSIGNLTDQIGWYVPAIPYEDTFVGYGSITDDQAKMWKSIPNRNIQHALD